MQLFKISSSYINEVLTLEREKYLVDRAKASTKAFGELYDMYYHQIYGYALRRTADVELSQDITSAVFYRALRNIRKYHWQGISISHWLFRIANHEIADCYKEKQRWFSFSRNTPGEQEKEHRYAEETLAAQQEVNRKEDYLDLHNCIKKLGLRYQEVITLKFFEDKDIREISLILDKPEGTVKSLLHRGVEQMRKLLELQE